MKHRSTQLATRKNPDSPRVHGSRISGKEFVESEYRENVSLPPSREIEGLDVASAGLANEITVDKEKRVSRLPTVEFVKAMPVKPAQPAQNSVEGRELHQLKSDNRFEPLLDVVEAAMLLRMHPRTLRAKARKRIIPAIQVGRRWRFRVSTLNTWLERLPS